MSPQQVSVEQAVEVSVTPARAFEVFTAQMGAWWPASHSIGTAPIADVVVEGREGGRWYERGADGSECPWGQVATWQPPHRLVLIWQVSMEWRYDPDLQTEIEVNFVERPDGGTRVELVHRYLERYGEHTAAVHGIFVSPQGWPGILEALQTAAATATAAPGSVHANHQPAAQSATSGRPDVARRPLNHRPSALRRIGGLVVLSVLTGGPTSGGS